MNSTARPSQSIPPNPDPHTAKAGSGVTLLSLQEAVDILTAEGGEFESIPVEIRGVVTKTWAGCPASLRQVVEDSVTFGDREFLVYYDRDGAAVRMTYAEHYRAVCQLGAALVERYGIVKGDRVAIASRNLPEWSVAFWAVVSVGAVAVPLNAWWTGPEMVYGLNDSGSKLLFADDERVKRLLPHMDQVMSLEAGLVLDAGDDLPSKFDLLSDLLAQPAAGAANLPPASIAPDDDATIFYTSGTTGFPKGALGTHRNACSNLRATQFIKRRGEVRTGVASDPEVQLASLLSVPLFHVTGCQSTLLPSIAGGSKLVLTYRFDAEQTVRILEQEAISSFGGVPTLVWRVLQAKNFKDHDLSSVVRVAYGGAPAAPELVRRIQQEFPQATSSNGYGLTETSALSVGNAGPEYLAKPTSAGLPLPVCDVKVCDDAGAELGVGEIGELWISGPNVIKGYWNRPEATAEAFVDGWLKTGDLARLDDEGYIYICDRAKDMVIRAGENVYCAEVEAALQEHPQVVAAAVYGVDEQVLGEEVAATVQLATGQAEAAAAEAPVDQHQLRAFCAERIASFKVPTVWSLGFDELPLNANGKVLKTELRERAEAKRACDSL